MAFHCYSNTIQYMTVHVLETTPQPYSLRGLSGSVCGYAGGGVLQNPVFLEKLSTYFDGTSGTWLSRCKLPFEPPKIKHNMEEEGGGGQQNYQFSSIHFQRHVLTNLLFVNRFWQNKRHSTQNLSGLRRCPLGQMHPSRIILSACMSVYHLEGPHTTKVPLETIVEFIKTWEGFPENDQKRRPSRISKWAPGSKVLT